MGTREQLDALAREELAQAMGAVQAMPSYLFTPQEWAGVAMRQAREFAGTPEGAAKLAEAKRYLACQEALARMALRVAELKLSQHKRG